MTADSEADKTRMVAASPAFKELVQRRGRFVRVAMGLCCTWFTLVVVLIAFAHEPLSAQIVPGLSVAYLLGLSVFVMVWGVSYAYLRQSKRVFMPLEHRALSESDGVR